MSHKFSTVTNKQQKHLKVHYDQYLYNSGEPGDNASSDSPIELGDELLGNSDAMRRRFRHIAQRMRDRYS